MIFRAPKLPVWRFGLEELKCVMGRGSRLKILLGACIIGIIGIVVHSSLLVGAAVVLLLLSCLRNSPHVPTNYTEKFGPADPSAESNATPFNVELGEDDEDD